MTVINIIFIVIILGVFITAYILYKKSKEQIPTPSIKEKSNIENIELIETENVVEQKSKKEEIIKKYGIVVDNTINDEKELEGEFEEVHD